MEVWDCKQVAAEPRKFYKPVGLEAALIVIDYNLGFGCRQLYHAVWAKERRKCQLFGTASAVKVIAAR